ncbi:MAG: hypothetical protein NWT08_07980 [Akkermansiaceae bacterium]|jgi:hypothetical protein|nr:hypothetical protein [Akkermansiaceae bacterium]MDP4647884.1 hypothetical protein [Akkermansiaceae bacterium]MDP4719674.1 hypothetical protein [Akkermansiaceae bacterium]MDP4779770.1 hypothetical protein [Akkermansiaceae bacterium]MDP4897827.1 hypothetical protein [Akkermansiaceae bacterium]
MTQRKLLIPAGICLFTVALSIILISSRNNDGASEPDSSAENAPNSVSSQASPAQETVSETKREREDPEAAIARRNLEKEFDELLPAKYPQQYSSLCDVSLKLGESVILGGFKRSDGDYEFTRISVTPLNAADSRDQYSIKTEQLILTADKTTQAGLDSLLIPAKTQIQNYKVMTDEENFTSRDGITFQSRPTVITSADSTSLVMMGTDEGAIVMSFRVNPFADKESIRLRTRIETPGDMR